MQGLGREEEEEEDDWPSVQLLADSSDQTCEPSSICSGVGCRGAGL